MTYLSNADKGRKCPSVVRFPPRRQSAVFIIPERLGGFYTVFGSRGWLFPNLGDAWEPLGTVVARVIDKAAAALGERRS